MRLPAILLLFFLPALAADGPFLFSFFRNNGEEGLFLATSADGLDWTELHSGKPLLKPEVGESRLMRDPSVTPGPDGTFHMVWTTSWQGRTIGYSSSKDLIHWTPQRAIAPFGPDALDVQNCWAPELFYDSPSKTYWIVFASTRKGQFPETAGSGSKDNNHRLYSIETRDFQTFTPAHLFYDPGFEVIDGAVFRTNDGRYALIAKNETEKPTAAKNLFLAFAPKISGPWSKAGPPISGSHWAEGPTPVKIGTYWYIYFDLYRDHKYGAIRSKNLIGWEDVTNRLRMPPGIKHGTAFPAPQSIVDGLLQ